ncbi:MAG: ATP-dependent DNA helicase, partial [Burkholderiales bacterium]
MAELESIFSESGALAQALPNYRVRACQIEMADRVAGAITKHDVLVAEAGTGTGKTFAYLVPALVSSARIIVSTGTKTLQDQLFDRDIPALKNALHVSATVALLKGRANYVCRYRLQRARDAGNSDAQLRIVSRFANISQTGDRGELAEVPEDAKIWPLVTSTRENCLTGECPEFKRCFVMEARKKALSADIVVVNHHLFFADLALRDEGLGELLPACDAVIFDEAHQLPEVARMFFGERVSTGQIVELARDTGTETLTCAPDFTPLLEAAAALDKGARDLRLTLGQTGKIAAAAVPPRFDLVLAEVSKRLRLLNTLLETQSQRSPGLANCQQRCAE